MRAHRGGRSRRRQTTTRTLCATSSERAASDSPAGVMSTAMGWRARPATAAAAAEMVATAVEMAAREAMVVVAMPAAVVRILCTA